KQQLTEVLGAVEGARIAKIIGTVSAGEFAGKYIVNKDNLEGKIDQQFEQSLAKLTINRHRRIKPRRDEKILVSWNGLMITSLAKASVIYGHDPYLQAAIKAGGFIWNNMRTLNGRIIRSHFSGVSGVEGKLNDYAKLAQGFINLYDASGQRVWLERAEKLVNIIVTDFADKKNGDFYASSNIESFARNKPRSDSSQPSANATTLDVISRLSNRLAKPELTRRAEKALAVMSGLAANSPSSGASILTAADAFLRGEQGAVQFAGNGAVRIVAMPVSSTGKLEFQLTVAKGWHVNSNQPLEEDYVATNLIVKANGKALATETYYPKPIVKTLGFSKSPLALLESNFQIIAQIKDTDAATISAELTVQTCSDEVCLLPETIKLKVPMN
ncbi:MAG: protein-disulfide reductase DsbD domain-containing protein, partial [Rhizobiaceae bacterium]